MLLTLVDEIGENSDCVDACCLCRRSARDQELELRIKKHTTMMMERRKQPKGTPQEEMEAAKKELEMVRLWQIMYP